MPLLSSPSAARSGRRLDRSFKTLGLSLFAVLLVAFAWHSATHAIDFPVYYAAGSQILHGNYDLYPQALYEGARAVSGHGFRYAPAIAFLFVPFALLPPDVAALVFFCLKIPAFVYIFTVIARRAPAPQSRGRLMLLTVLVVGGYLVEEFRNGNFHFLSVFLMVVAFDQADRRKVILPGVALALAIAAKLLPAVLLPYFVLRRRFKAAAATLGALAVLWLLPAAVVGMETNNRLTGAFVRFAVQKADEQANHSLRGTAFRYLAFNPDDDPRNPDVNVANLPEPAVAAVVLGLEIIGAVILVVALWRPPRDNEGLLLDWSLILTAMLLGSPHTQRIYFSALVVPVGVLLALLARHPRLPGRGLTLTALILAGLVGTLLPLVLTTRRVAVAFEAISPNFTSVFVLGVSLLFLTVRFRRPPTGAI